MSARPVMTDAKAREALQRHAQGQTFRVIAAAIGVNPITVHRFIRSKTGDGRRKLSPAAVRVERDLQAAHGAIAEAPTLGPNPAFDKIPDPAVTAGVRPVFLQYRTRGHFEHPIGSAGVRH